ncbi:hypothetical protein [Novosphingobium huizhouense]|uniref:hypothetical protein n=1 Tax=Novosphingobium huizhouense TaxID=2866625 RepID=UPI001CD8DBCE|nr:hypothetical protein [Novosphingobium huizhouense]
MIVTAHRMRSIGWLALLAICAALVMVLAFRVNALRSQVRHAELKIVALRQEKMYLETEFETRANQQQLKAWNDVEFGYVAPTAGQYLENERQLAALSKPAEPDAPEPIRVASADDAVVAQAAFPAMVSPLSGKPLGAGADEDEPAPAKVDHARAAASLGARLARVDHGDEAPVTPRIRQLVAKDDEAGDAPAKKPAKDKSAKDGPAKDGAAKDKPVDKRAAKPSAKVASATKPEGAKKTASAAAAAKKPVAVASKKPAAAVAKKPAATVAKKEVKKAK